MKPQSQHAQEDRLLEFVYGELPPVEARAVESHLEGCTHCSQLLAGIRGVRTTMKQLHTEPAPDAGLESLLAYAQQAARNAAVGPAPKPTWWRRWLVPAFGVAAVCAFGIISIQVSKTVDLKPQLSANSERASAYKDEQPPSAPPMANAAPAPAPEPVAESSAEPVAGLATKEGASRQKLSKPSPAMMPKADYGNAGAGFGRADADDAEAGKLDEKKSADKVAKRYEYAQRDAMTQAGPLRKAMPTMRRSAQEAMAPEPMPAPGAAQPATDEAPKAIADATEVDGQLKQEVAAQSPLRLGGSLGTGSSSTNKTVDSSAGDDFDDLLKSKSSMALREQEQVASAPPPPPSASAPPRPVMPSASTAAPAAPSKRPEAKGKSASRSSSELSRLADAALRSGDRVREAQYLTQALEAGATGSERLGLLNRLCDAEFSLGRRQTAIEACNLVLEEGPRSGAAQVARKRLSSESLPSKAGSSNASNRAAPAEQQAPASSAPVQAQ